MRGSALGARVFRSFAAVFGAQGERRSRFLDINGRFMRTGNRPSNRNLSCLILFY